MLEKLGYGKDNMGGTGPDRRHSLNRMMMPLAAQLWLRDRPAIPGLHSGQEWSRVQEGRRMVGSQLPTMPHETKARHM